MRKTLILIASTLLSGAAFAQQPDYSKVDVKVTKVAGTVYMLQGAGGNIGVSVGDDGIVLIDDEFAPLAPKIKDALKTLSTKPIKFVLNTHYHGDHTGGNEVFGREGTIIAHENVRKRLQSGTKTLGRETPPASSVALPVVTFNDRATIHFNGEDIRAIHLPHGHTDGDAVIFFSKSNVVHMGDDFFLGMFPFIDLDNGGSVRGMIKNCETVLAQIDNNTKIIPGHGGLADKQALSSYVDVLKGTVAIMNEAIQKGMTLEEVKREKVLAAWSNYATTFITLERYEEFLYTELKPASSPTK